MKATDFEHTDDEIRYVDGSTGRHFAVRVKEGPTSIEAVVGKAVPAGVRYFVEEFVPNGRFASDPVDGKPAEYIDVPKGAWAKARITPSAAWKCVRRFEDKHPGFFPVMVGSGYSVSAIFYPDLDECARAITNALDADMWVISHEPTKHVTLADGVRATLEAKSMLDRLTGGDQVLAVALDLGRHLPEGESAVVAEHAGGFRIDVTSEKREYPDSCRLLLIYTPEGRPVSRNAFVRGQWGDVVRRLIGFEPANYDGPAGTSRGFPAFGQRIGGFDRRPEQVVDCEVLHKQEGTSNKIYVFAQVGAKRFFAWGRFSNGRLATKPAGSSSYGQMSKKRDRGYDRIDPDGVPGFWTRLMAAAQESR